MTGLRPLGLLENTEVQELLDLDVEGGEAEGGLQLLLSTPFGVPLALDQGFVATDSRQGLQVLAIGRVFQGCFDFVSRAQNQLIVVLG